MARCFPHRHGGLCAGNPSKTSLVWVDREGKIELLGNNQDENREASLSPDGTKAIVRDDLDLWVHDLQRGTARPPDVGDGEQHASAVEP